MKRLFGLFWILLFAISPLYSQISSSTARHIIASASLPATCSPTTGDIYFIVSAGPIGTPYYCSAPNTWSIWNGGGSGGTCAALGTTSGPIQGTCINNFFNPSGVTLPNGSTATTQANGDATSKLSTDAFVANVISSINPAVNVQAATVAVLSNTPTYNNGTAGVSATLIAGSNGALTVDGYAVLLNDRIMVKNQASTLQNGFYTLTTLGTGGVPYVLTRATDYNSPVNINYTGSALILQGSTLIGQSWHGPTNIVTVGTDAIVFTQDPTPAASPGGGNVKATGSLTNNQLVIGQGGKTIAATSAIPNGITAITQAPLTNNTTVGTTAYTDAAVAAGLASSNPATSVKACSAAALPAVTYSNGASGIGATLTENSAAALVVDGYTSLLGDRLLVKNQASAFQNGVYTMTTLGTGIIPFVLTRALDFDQPSDINNTGPIGCQTGTVGAPGGLPTTWLLVTAVTTVGTDPITFAQTGFGGNATTTVCSGTIALGTSLIASGAAGTTSTSTCTGLATTDTIQATFNGTPLATTGFVPSANGMLGLVVWPTANTINVSQVNNTSASITPGAVTLNYRVVR
jgi:hypothetical protein